MVKRYAKDIAGYIMTLFNKSLENGYFPRSFKTAEITPVLEKPSLDSSLPVPVNYHPISNLPFILKLLERAVNVQLLHHLQLNGLLPEHQSAYRKSRSTKELC